MFAGLDGPEFRDADLVVGQDLEQERFELVVGPVDLVDEQHRSVTLPDGLEQRPFQQELGPEQLVDGLLVGGLGLRQGPYLQHLPGVVPLVQRLAGGDALVALQPDELAAEDRREDLGDLCLADADLAFEQHGPGQRKRHEQGRRQPAVGEVNRPAAGFQ